MYAQRIATVQRYLQEQKLDALLVSNFNNIYYLTGFYSLSPSEREAWILVTQKECYFFTDGRYLTQELSKKMHSISIEPKLIDGHNTIGSHLKSFCKGMEVVGFESHSLTFHEYDYFSHTLKPSVLKPVERVIEECRRRKNDVEISHIEKASKCTDDLLKMIKTYIKPGRTEKEVLYKMEDWIKKHNLGMAFEPFIVAVDENSAIAHYDTRFGDKQIQQGSVVLIDCGVRYEGYVSDITRVFFIGKPDDEKVATYNSLLKAQVATVEKVAIGFSMKELDAFCRQNLVDAGYPSYPHSTGHGVGIEIHESPRISMRSDEIFSEGDMCTIEPGIYYEGKWGMRIEDTIVVNDEVKVLTSYPKNIEAVIV